MEPPSTRDELGEEKSSYINSFLHIHSRSIALLFSLFLSNSQSLLRETTRILCRYSKPPNLYKMLVNSGKKCLRQHGSVFLSLHLKELVLISTALPSPPQPPPLIKLMKQFLSDSWAGQESLVTRSQYEISWQS